MRGWVSARMPPSLRLDEHVVCGPTLPFLIRLHMLDLKGAA
jgi:hypothetical protein